MELDVVEEEIESVLFTTYNERILTTEEGKAHPEFEEKIADMVEEAPLQVVLLSLFCQSQEVEVVGVFDKLLGEVRLRRREDSLEVSDSATQPGE